jgi:NTE family protein
MFRRLIRDVTTYLALLTVLVPAAIASGDEWASDSLPKHPAYNISGLKKSKIGLVLSGGGARGFAQIGVIRALEEAGFIPEFVVGTSIGSVVGGLYSSGYTPQRLEELVRTIDWAEVLSLSNRGERENLLVDQKPIQDRSILSFRFDGMYPTLPVAVSTGQRLNNLLNELALQGLYRNTDFDKLKIPFRAVATDLYTGNRMVIGSGSLSEAMRASSTLPILYAGVAKDSMLLVDGGMRSNIPIDVARSYGCDIVIAVNTGSPPRSKDQVTSAIDMLDQILNIMISQESASKLGGADVVVTPVNGSFLSTDFSKADTLLKLGYSAGKQAASVIDSLCWRSFARTLPKSPSLLEKYYVDLPVGSDSDGSTSSRYTIRDAFLKACALDRTGAYEKMEMTLPYAESDTIRLVAQRKPDVSDLRLTGVQVISPDRLREYVLRSTHAAHRIAGADYYISRVLEFYRMEGYSLARVDSAELDAMSGILTLRIDEGKIKALRVEGNTKTIDVVILREFPLQENSVFRISDLRRGLKNISSLNLFHTVSFGISELPDGAIVTIHVDEKPSQVLQVSLLLDNERNAQLGLDIRDVNFLGIGASLSGSFFGGFKNRTYAMQYNTNKIFYTPLNFSLKGYYDIYDYNEYADLTQLPPNRFERRVSYVYRRAVYGSTATAGMYLERIGNIFGSLRYEQQQIRTVEFHQIDAEGISEDNRIFAFHIGTNIDTQDRYPYPRKGIKFTASYVSAQKAFEGSVAFSKFYSRYEFYAPIVTEKFVFHPKIEFGYGDKTLPKTEQFRMGGIYSFLGMQENEFNGRQLFVASAEVRYHLPIQILFDSFVSVRYDLGRSWEFPEQIRFDALRHGFGVVLGIDTPLGPADLAVGRSFLIYRSYTALPLQWGPMYLYFSIGMGI